MIDSYDLAMLPVTYMLGQADPFDRYCKGLDHLDASYRDVINNGIWLYQLHTYHALVGSYFGRNTQSIVRNYQRSLFAAHGSTGKAIENAMQMIDDSLDLEKFATEKEAANDSIPVEMYVSLVLLLNDPASPDYVESASQKETQINRIGEMADWCMTRCLIAARDEITSIFSPMLAHLDLNSTNQQ